MYAAYKKAYKLSAKKAKIKLLETNILNPEEALKAEIEATKEVLEFWDKNIKKTVCTVKNEIRSSFELYDSKVNELLELRVKRQEAEEDED